MKNFITLLIIAICGVVSADAQTNQRPASISSSQKRVVISDDARFELVRFGTSVIRLDRYTGKTHLSNSGDRKWYLLTVRGGLPGAAGSTTPKYQIFIEENFYPLLFNNETGQTWIFATQTWEPMID